MRINVLTTAAIVVVASACNRAPPAPLEPPPRWAYPGAAPPDAPGSMMDDGGLLHAEGAATAFTRAQLTDLFAAPDWHPGAHPAMPPIVARGRMPTVQACAYCHLPTGDGRPENASLAGLPYDYIVDQMRDMRSGKRTTSVRERAPQAMMLALASAVTDEEIAAAARYFAALEAHAHVQVVETSTAPRPMETHWIMAKDPAGGTEPLGVRIIEVPEDLGKFDLRDDSARFVAYVPRGSIARGEALVQRGGPGKTMPCGSCHGADLRGTGTVPGLAGRSPTYLVRQLYDLKSGARAGANATQMKAVVGNLSEEDMVVIAAYVASRPMSP